MRPLTPSSFVLWLASASFVCSLAVAAPKGYEAQYAAALKREKAGQFVEALAAFEAIPDAKRDWLTRSHIANLEAKLGRLLRARASFEAILGDPKLDASERDTTRSDLDELIKRIPRIRLTTASTDVVITVDDRAVEVPATIEVDPGPHVVRGRRGGNQVFEREVDLSESSTVDVEVNVPAPVTVLPIAAKPSIPPAEIHEERSTTKNVGYIVAAVGLASLAVGGVFTIRAIGARDRRDDLARSGDPAAVEAHDDARTALTIARIGVVAGIIGTTLGTFLVVRSPRSESKAAAMRVAPCIGATTWGISFEGAW